MIQADANGVMQGRFTVPTGIPAGVKKVEVIGDWDSRGEATFVGEGAVITETKRVVTTVTTQRYDPLAETFTMNQARQIAAVDLWFTKPSTKPVMVQIRETLVGMPTQTILAECRLQPDEISVAQGVHTRVKFAHPIHLDADTEYALVILTNDSSVACAVAELGKFDSTNHRWVTSQPYQIGVLLSSSNASTWTPHQDRDLTFRLLAADYQNTQRTIDLGHTHISNASDLVWFGFSESPTAQARIEYELTLPDDNNSKVSVSDGQPMRLGKKVSGEVAVKAKLTGTRTSAPVLWPGAQLVSGTVSESAEYVSRAIPAGRPCRVRVIVDAVLPSGAGLSVQVQPNAGSWQEMSLVTSSAIGDGAREMNYEIQNVNAETVRVKLKLTGSTASRPICRNLRVIVL